MKRWRGWLAAALLVCISGSALAINDATLLHREGRWLVDAQARRVQLHGVNAVWKLAPYAPPATAEGFTAADADFLAASGFNVVRLGVLFAGVMPQPGVIDNAYLAQVDRVVQLLAARRIWVLLDFHQDQLNERWQGEGFPPWAVFDAPLLPNDARYGFPLNEFASLKLNRAYDAFWANRDGIWTRYRDAWIAVAQRWRNQPYLLGYDLFNEPWPGTRWPTCFERDCVAFDARLQAFHEFVLAGVRNVDTRHLVFFEPQQLFDFGAPSGFVASADPALGFAWHAYCSATLLEPLGLSGGPDCPIIEPRTFNNAERQSAQLGAVSLLTEFGASDDVRDIGRIVDLSENSFVSWVYWAYKAWRDPTGNPDSQGLFARDDDLASLKAPKADLLIRPYAQAIAGTPLSHSFDPGSRRFQLHYAPRVGIAAATEIFLPARHYPQGYRVQVSGGQVLSAPGASILRIVNAPGTDAPVEVLVEPLL